jgi:hypothetical protein
MDPNAQKLREEIDHGKFTVDREQGMIFGVKLCSKLSKNNREYTRPALEDLTKLYEYLPIRIDHDEKGYLKTVGSVQKAELNRIDYDIRGDISLNKGHPAYDQIMEDAEHRPHLLKLSHEIPARGYQATQAGDKLVVNRVHKVDCFAIVTNGGVNQSLFEAADEEDDDVEIKTLAELKTAMPALYEELEKVLREEVANDHEDRIKLIQDRDNALQKLHEAEEKLAAIDEEKQLAARKEAILAKAKERKVSCSADLLEALVPLEDEKVDRILEHCPAIKEDGSTDSPEKPTQRSGLGKKPKGYESPADWYREKVTS